MNRALAVPAVIAVLAMLLVGCIGSITEDEFDAELGRRRRTIAPDVVLTGLEQIDVAIGTDDPTLARLTVSPPVVDYWILDRSDGTVRSWTWDGFDLVGPRALPEDVTDELAERPFTVADVPALDRLADLAETARELTGADEDETPAILVADHGRGPRILVQIDELESWFRPDGTPEEAGS